MGWVFWALAHTLIYGSVNQFNRYLQLPGNILARWRALMPALMVLPFIFIYTPPTDPVFYLACIIGGAMVLTHDRHMYDVSAKYGGQVAFRLRSLILPIVFIAWLILKPQQLQELLNHPLMALGLVACFGLIMIFLMRLAQCQISRAAFFDMLPVIITGAIFDITNKTAMDHAPFPNNTLYYVFIVSGLPIIASMLLAGRNMPTHIREMAGIANKAAPLTTLVIFSMITRNLAMMATPNPAYVTAITLTTPFWIMLWMRLRGETEKADWIAGSGLVLTVLMMTLIIAYIH